MEDADNQMWKTIVPFHLYTGWAPKMLDLDYWILSDQQSYHMKKLHIYNKCFLYTFNAVGNLW